MDSQLEVYPTECVHLGRSNLTDYCVAEGAFMSSTEKILSCISHLKGISNEEAVRIWKDYFPRLLVFTQRRISSLPKRSFDEEDVALSAMNSFFRAQRLGRFELTADFGDLWPILVTIVSRKITSQRRKHFSLKRGGGAVKGESALFGSSGIDSEMELGIAQIMDDNHLPETSDAMARTCEELLTKLPDEKHKQTALMRMEGFTIEEISETMQCSVARTKQRVARIRQIWAEDDNSAN
jgi:DNA-directed RNA polymerase specialized sigma24 family protein